MKGEQNMKKVLALLIAALMAVSSLAACGGSDLSESSESQPSSQSSGAEDPQTSSQSEEPAAGGVATGPDDTSTPYSFTCYANYEWWAIKPWGQDAASAYMKELFNVDIEWSKPDADPAAKLNLMISSDDLPDTMIMDRNQDLIKVAQLGMLQDFAPLQYPGNPFDEWIPQQTQELLKIDGKLYGVPDWCIKEAGGGNNSWNINQEVYKALGSPELKTLDDLYDYAVKVRNSGLKTPDGADIIPFMGYDAPDGMRIIDAFYRSYGGPNYVAGYFARVDGKLQFILRDEKFKVALKEANRWYRDGLFAETIVTDTADQVVEKLITGRPALAYYDFSQDSVNHFRQLLMQATNNQNSYEILTDPIFPPAEGVTRVFGQYNATTGGGWHIITKKAENPQRIFDLWGWMLTKDGAINIMYGPKGGLWDEFDENGNPILKVPEARLTAEEKNAAGCWFWASPAHSNSINDTKYAVNAALPKEDQDWTVSIQDNIFTPKGGGAYVNGQKFVTDEDVGIVDTIDPKEDLGISRKLILDECGGVIPKILLSKDDSEFESLYSGLLQFAEENKITEIEKRYDEKYQQNCELQGGSFYEKNG